MTDGVMLLPSRGRPHLLQRFFDVGKPVVPGVVILDDDDFENYDGVTYPQNWQTLVIPRGNIVQKQNRAFEVFPDADWYGMTSDDVIPESAGWDVVLRDAAGRRNFAWGNDGFNNRFATAVIGGDLTRCIGWLLCPWLKHFYTDDVYELMRDMGLGIYLPDVKVTHKHFANGGTYDRTYADRGNPEDDKAAFERWRTAEWPMLRQRLAHFMRVTNG